MVKNHENLYFFLKYFLNRSRRPHTRGALGRDFFPITGNPDEAGLRGMYISNGRVIEDGERKGYN
jgi:hypothetical protein